MVEKEKISQEEADATPRKVVISGAAKEILTPKKDSLLIIK
jgi:hypothetical protein